MTLAQAGNHVWTLDWPRGPAAGCWPGAGLLATGALAIAARNIALSRQGRLTGRYAKAVEQLGSAELDVRIGSIHTLERVAREAPADHPAVMEILASFIREHSPPQWPPADPGGQVRERSLRPDVQAAMTVVGRRLPNATPGLLTSPARINRRGPGRRGPGRRGPWRRQAHRRGSQRRRSHRRRSRRHRPDGRGPHRHRLHPRGSRCLVAIRVASSGELDAIRWLWPADTGRRWR